jgi:hypothetical protein
VEKVIHREYQGSVFKLLSNIDRLAALSISMWVGRDVKDKGARHSALRLARTRKALSVRSYSRLKTVELSLFAFDQFLPSRTWIIGGSSGCTFVQRNGRVQLAPELGGTLRNILKTDCEFKPVWNRWRLP